MKHLSKLLSLAVLAAFFALASCNNDDEKQNELPKDQAKAKIDEFSSTAVNDLQSLNDADGLKAIKDMFDLVDTDDPFSRVGHDKKTIGKFFRAKGREFKSFFVPRKATGARTTDNEPFDFESKVGVYEWDPVNQEFNKTDESDIIIILFPTEGSETNDAELRLLAYSEESYFDEEWEETYYNPEVIQAELYVDQVEVASLDLDVEWNEDFPESVDISVSVTPFTATLSFSGTASSSTISVALLKNSDIVVAAGVTATFENNTKTDENLKSLEGYVQLRNLKIQGNVDVNGANNQEEPDLNDFIHLALYAGNDKLGDIVFVYEDTDDDGFDDTVLYLKYADGTQEKLEDVLQEVIDEIEALTEGLDDNG